MSDTTFTVPLLKSKIQHLLEILTRKEGGLNDLRELIFLLKEFKELSGCKK